MLRLSLSKTIIAAVSVGLAALLAAVILMAATATSEDAIDTSEPLMLRGENVDPSKFLLTSLHRIEDRRRVDRLRHEFFESCMADRGFPEPPSPGEFGEDDLTDYARRYSLAAGDDPSLTEPPPVDKVKLPDGSTIEIGSSLSPDSCGARAEAFPLGDDPTYREAMSWRLQALIYEADQRALADAGAKPILEEFKACSGLDDQWALLEASRPAIPGDPQLSADSKVRACATERLVSEVNKIRAPYHYWIATRDDTERLVAAWVDLIDAEIAHPDVTG